MSYTNDTICAIATAPGGAIGIIRVSGPQSISLTDSILRTGLKEGIVAATPYSLTYGKIVANEEVIDEVLVATYRAPHSYTGEDSTEIMCHGSSYILQRIMELLVSSGARQALPGEYTQRAFLNGKMDLSQAEAVADLIASSNAATHRMAMRQLRGGFKDELNILREKLLQLTTMLELELDFSEEDVEFADRTQLSELVEEIKRRIESLLHSFHVGNALKNGIPVAIIGETNVGKSTLLNRLLHEEKAIVSDIQGTTRDVIEDCINIQGVVFRFIDTAGIRETTDYVEKLGIERTWSKIDEAQIILWIVDASQSPEEVYQLYQTLSQRIREQKVLLVYNKSDKYHIPQNITRCGRTIPFPYLYISAQTGDGIENLQNLLLESTSLPNINTDDIIVTNLRHYEALKHALNSIKRVQNSIALSVPNDLVGQDLRECLFHLAEITGGAITSDEVLTTVFKNFCIGK